MRQRLAKLRAVPEPTKGGKAVRGIDHLVTQIEGAAVDGLKLLGPISSRGACRDAERDLQLQLQLIPLSAFQFAFERLQRPGAVLNRLLVGGSRRRAATRFEEMGDGLVHELGLRVEMRDQASLRSRVSKPSVKLGLAKYAEVFSSTRSTST